MEINDWPREKMLDRLRRYQDLASLAYQTPRNWPKLPGVDYFVGMQPREGKVGGDNIVIVNFQHYNLEELIKRAHKSGNAQLEAALKGNRDKFGILVADATGHTISDAVVINSLDLGFRLGVGYELANKGEVTAELFERLNDEWYDRTHRASISHPPLITLLYGEVNNDGRFRYLSAGHPHPIIFSNEFDRIVKIEDDRRQNSTPLGVLPTKYHSDMQHFTDQVQKAIRKKMPVNELTLLSAGDIMILYTDGLVEQDEGRKDFSAHKLEEVLRKAKKERAKNIYAAIVDEYKSYAAQEDDLSIAVVKKK